MKITNKVSALFIVAGVLMLFTVFGKTDRINKNKLEFSCSAHLDNYDEVNELHMSTNAIFIFRKDGQGVVTLDGNIKMKERPYKLSRVINFNYDYFAQHTYTKVDKKIIINKKDTLPPGMFEDKYFSGDYFYVSLIDGVENVILLGSRLSPAFMCVVD